MKKIVNSSECWKQADHGRECISCMETIKFHSLPQLSCKLIQFQVHQSVEVRNVSLQVAVSRICLSTHTVNWQKTFLCGANQLLLE
jgi:hypothetical protein